MSARDDRADPSQVVVPLRPPADRTDAAVAPRTHRFAVLPVAAWAAAAVVVVGVLVSVLLVPGLRDAAVPTESEQSASPSPAPSNSSDAGMTVRVGGVVVAYAIVLVQIWAADEDALARWLPRAEALLGTLTLAPAN